MDSNDYQKTSHGKDLEDNVESMREKLSRQVAEVIKEKVSRDAAFGELKEKLEQVENNYERLQQNMVEVQTQYEAISGKYQEELRLRPEILNKLRIAREISDVLEEYCEALKETLSRCKADQVALYDIYQKSESVVRDARCKLEQQEKINEQLVENMREKDKLSSEQHSEMLKFCTATKQQADSELAELRAKLSSVQTQREDLQKEIFDYIQHRQQLQNQIESLNKEKSDAAWELNRLMNDLEAKRVAIDKLLEQESVLKRSYEEVENAFKSYRDDAEAKIKNLHAELQVQNKEIDSKTDAVNVLMSEVKMGTEARSKLEGVVQKLNKDMEREKDASKEREKELWKRIKQLEATTARSPLPQKRSAHASPRSEPYRADNMAYNAFSDTSGDTIDTNIVNSRFAAPSRGKNPPPMHPSTSKHRSNVP